MSEAKNDDTVDQKTFHGLTVRSTAATDAWPFSIVVAAGTSSSVVVLLASIVKSYFSQNYSISKVKWLQNFTYELKRTCIFKLFFT